MLLSNGGAASTAFCCMGDENGVDGISCQGGLFWVRLLFWYG